MFCMKLLLLSAPTSVFVGKFQGAFRPSLAKKLRNTVVEIRPPAIKFIGGIGTPSQFSKFMSEIPTPLILELAKVKILRCWLF